MLSLVSIVLAALAVGWLAYVAATNFVPRPFPDVPRAGVSSFFWGDSKALLAFYKQHGRLHEYFDRLADSLGPVFQFHFLADCGRPALVISDSKIIHELLTRRTDVLDRSPSSMRIFRALAPEGALSLRVDKVWKHHRRLMAPSMGSKTLRRFVPTIIRSTTSLLELWEAKRSRLEGKEDRSRPEDSCFFASSDVALLTLDIISDLAFGQSYHQLEDTLEAVKTELYQGNKFPERTSTLAAASMRFFQALQNARLFPRISHVVLRLRSAEYCAAEQMMAGFLNRQIKDGRKRVRESGAEGSILDSILEKEWEEEKAGQQLLSVSELRDELNILLIAGSETTANTMAWMLRYLTGAPEVQKRVHAEVKASLPLNDDELSLDNLTADNMPYLEAVIQETLRKCTTVCAVHRQVYKETEILGRVVPSGTRLVLLIGKAGYAADSSAEKGHLETGWRTDDVYAFNPERWLHTDGRFNVKAGPSIPWGGGVRGCFGKALAILELKIFLVLFSRAFFLEVVPDTLSDTEGKLVTESITRSPGGVWVKLSKCQDREVE